MLIERFETNGINEMVGIVCDPLPLYFQYLVIVFAAIQQLRNPILSNQVLLIQTAHEVSIAYLMQADGAQFINVFLQGHRVRNLRIRWLRRNSFFIFTLWIENATTGCA